LFPETLDHFFNPNEFAVNAMIRGKLISGLLSKAYSTESSDHFIFLCSASSVAFVTIRDHMLIENQHYQIVGIQQDGTGLASFTLAMIGNP
jgi:hypothetical protein